MQTLTYTTLLAAFVALSAFALNPKWCLAWCLKNGVRLLTLVLALLCLSAAIWNFPK